jgi:NAD(P)H-dependent FMN reductase
MNLKRPHEGDMMLKIGIITGSTRPNRKSLDVARWVLETAQKRGDAQYELVDIQDFELPLFDEPAPPILGQYQRPHTKRWAERVASLDGFVFVTPEYNHGIPAALKNAIDFLFAEWNHKAAGFVSYGGSGGVRAVEQLRLVLAEVRVATVRAQLTLSMWTDFESFSTFRPTQQHEKSLGSVLDEVLAWSGTLKSLRSESRR